MTISLRSFETRFGYYQNANAVLQTWGDYTPTNPVITKAANTAFISDVGVKNGEVTTKEQAFLDNRNERRTITFRVIEGADINCLENRIRNIGSFIEGELPTRKAAIKKIKSFIRKIKPLYKKRTEGEPRGAGMSPSERSFAALVGYAKSVKGIITGLGLSYSPTNPNIQLANFSAFIDHIDQLNQDVATTEEVYGNAARERKDLYDGLNGMTDRIKLIRKYLASFPGGKLSPHYIEFSQAIKGV